MSLSGRGNAHLCLAVGLPASTVTPWVGWRPKGQRVATAQFERWGGDILGLRLAHLRCPVRCLQTFQPIFFLNRNVLLSEPVCGSCFEGRIGCVWRFLRQFSRVSPGCPGCLKLVSLAAPQQVIGSNAQMFCLCILLPFQPTGGVSSLSLGNLVNPGGAVRPRGRMRPTLRSAVPAEHAPSVAQLTACPLQLQCLVSTPGHFSTVNARFILNFFLTYHLGRTCSPRALVWAVCPLLLGAALLRPRALTTVEIVRFSWLFKLFVVSVCPPILLPSLCLLGW